MISVVIEACRTRFIVRVSDSISSPALLVAESIAVIRAACSAATDSSSAVEDLNSRRSAAAARSNSSSGAGS